MKEKSKFKIKEAISRRHVVCAAFVVLLIVLFILFMVRSCVVEDDFSVEPLDVPSSLAGAAVELDFIDNDEEDGEFLEEVSEEEIEPANADDSDSTSSSDADETGSVSVSSQSEDTESSGSQSSSSPSTNSSSSASSSSSSSSSSASEASSASSKTWVVDYEQVWVVDELSYTEEIPIYETVEISVCNICGEEITGSTSDHAKEHMLAGEGSGHHSEWIVQVVGYSTVIHEEVGHWESVEVGGHWE